MDAPTVLPLTHADRQARFGSFPFVSDPRPGNPERVVIRGDWVRQYLVEVDVPQLARFGRSTRLTVHYKAAEPLRALWAAWERSDLLGLVKSFDGLWVPRFKRQSGTEAGRAAKCKTLGAASLSNHAWGTAFDINASTYPLGKKLPPTDPFAQLFDDALALGWFPGAMFRSRPDPMHFEFAGLV